VARRDSVPAVSLRSPPKARASRRREMRALRPRTRRLLHVPMTPPSSGVNLHAPCPVRPALMASGHLAAEKVKVGTQVCAQHVLREEPVPAPFRQGRGLEVLPAAFQLRLVYQQVQAPPLDI
jgi:hypothetical protein